MGSSLRGAMMMSGTASSDIVTTFVTMRKEPPKAGEDWFRIVPPVNKASGEGTKVYLYDEIGMWGTSAKDFAAQLDEIDPKDGPIHLHVNSPGGSVFDGLAIHASIKNHKAETLAHVDGLAASAASFIIQAADKRDMGPNAQVMIHDARAFAGGNAEAMRKAAALLDQMSDNIADMYARRGTETKDQFRTRMKAEEWYNGQQAKDLGLVDEVTDNDDEEAEKDAKNKWDLEAMFRYPGIESAPPPAALLNQLTINPELKEHQVMDPATSPTVAQPPVAAVPPVPAAVPPVVAFDGAAADAAYTTVARFRSGETYDMAAIHNHISGLETFRTETIENARKEYVAQLAKDHKISAAKISETETFALSLSAEQFTAWKASQDSAPANSLFAQHGLTPADTGTGTPASVPTQTQNAVEARMEVLNEIIAGHRAGGMSEERLKENPSYKELENLKAQKAQQAPAA